MADKPRKRRAVYLKTVRSDWLIDGQTDGRTGTNA